MGSAGQGTDDQIGKAKLCKVLKGKLGNRGKLSSQITKDEQTKGHNCVETTSKMRKIIVYGGHKRHQEAVN